MTYPVGTDWLNVNSFRRYPLSQITTFSQDAEEKLPNSFFVDMKLAIPYVTGFVPTGFYVSSVTVYPQGLIFEIGYQNQTVDIKTVAVSAPIAFSSFVPNSSIAIRGVQTSSSYDLSQTYGVAVIGNVDFFKDKIGTQYFSIVQTRLESTVISFGARRLSGLRVQSEGAVTAVLSGQVTLLSGTNHRISVNSTAQGHQLTFNAIDGGGLQETCDCSDVELSPCIRTINQMPGDASGNISIVGGDCIIVESSNNEVSLADSCAKPCCGCNELQVVVSDVESMSAQLNGLANQIAILASSVQSLQNICLGSSIDPTSCAAEE